MSEPGISPLELITGLLILSSIAITYVLNRTRRREKKPIEVRTDVLAISLTLIWFAVTAIGRSGVITRSPLLFFVAAASLLGALLGILMSYLAWKVRSDVARLSTQMGSQVAGLGNLRYFATKEDTFKELTVMTLQAREKLLATRFSPGDISTEAEYWDAIKQVALDPKTLNIRIHCLAHTSSIALEGLCKLIAEFRGARQFVLGVTFQNNNFDMIIVDDQDCLFCFHDFQMTIKNGFRVDKSSPSSAHVVENMGATYRRMLDSCYVQIDFGKFVRTEEDVRKLQHHLTEMHRRYCEGRLPKVMHTSEMEGFLRSRVFQ